MTALQGFSAGVKDMADGSLRITIEFDPRFAKDAFSLFGSRGTPIAVAALTSGASVAASQSEVVAEPKKEPNQLARKLMIDGYFRNPKLWRLVDEAGIYTQKQHKAFIEQCNCLGSVDTFSKSIGCNGDIVLHHCRDASNSGTGIKPSDFYGVPLCHSHHSYVHSGIERYASEGIMAKAVDYTASRIKEAIKAHIGLASLSEITIQELTAFELELGL